jgi:diaminopropionate ammonia-lyase
MAGYGVLAAEIRRQVQAQERDWPTHVFVQAGVGGLAAAVADGLKGWMAPPAVIVVVEPERAPCVAAAIAAGRPVRIEGGLETTADMLSCGKASTPALAILRRHDVQVVTLSDARLGGAPGLLRAGGGPATTPSGAAGVAGLAAASADVAISESVGLCATSRVLVIITEVDIEEIR